MREKSASAARDAWGPTRLQPVAACWVQPAPVPYGILHLVDAVIFVPFIATAPGIGVFASRHAHDSEAPFPSGRGLPRG